MLTIKDLKVAFKTHRGDVQAVKGISFDLAKGERLGIVGESGSGKSVTSYALMRILTPVAGSNPVRRYMTVSISNRRRSATCVKSAVGRSR